MNKDERLAADGATNPLLFYGHKAEYGWLSNFSEHAVRMRHPFTGVEALYLTTEHRYQAMKATNQADHDYVRAAPKASHSKDRGREIALRSGWGNSYGDLCWGVMLEAVLFKAVQHEKLLVALDGTRDRTLYEDSPVDDIWGWRYHEDYRGKNLLGLAWMTARDILCF